jgi:voltage-gated potassium channel
MESLRERDLKDQDDRADSLLGVQRLWLEYGFVALGLVWLGLIMVELIKGENPLLEQAINAIWAIFVCEFGVKLFVAKHKLSYLRRNWLTALSLVLPALRVLRIVRLVRILGRGSRLVRIVSSLSRGKNSLAFALGRRGLSYVAMLSMVITVAGAAGMLSFEREHGLRTFGDALWFVAMLMTTMGSQYWPVTPEGRILAFILSLYGFATFGYVTAALASWLVSKAPEGKQKETELEHKIDELQRTMDELNKKLEAAPDSNDEHGRAA